MMRARAADTDDRAFAALADGTRRAVIGLLLTEPHAAGALAERLAISPPALSRHLRVLRRAGLIVERTVAHDARVRVYELAPEAFAPVRGLVDQVEAMWQRQLQAFARHAEGVKRARVKRKP
jgi:DNA-binding transcriptional ArsR family regulator